MVAIFRADLVPGGETVGTGPTAHQVPEKKACQQVTRLGCGYLNPGRMAERAQGPVVLTKQHGTFSNKAPGPVGHYFASARNHFYSQNQSRLSQVATPSRRAVRKKQGFSRGGTPPAPGQPLPWPGGRPTSTSDGPQPHRAWLGHRRSDQSKTKTCACWSCCSNSWGAGPKEGRIAVSRGSHPAIGGGGGP